MPDFSIRDEGSICILYPHSESAKNWCGEHLPEDATWWAGGCAVEPRYLQDILDGIAEDGLTYV